MSVILQLWKGWSHTWHMWWDTPRVYLVQVILELGATFGGRNFDLHFLIANLIEIHIFHGLWAKQVAIRIYRGFFQGVLLKKNLYKL